MGSQTLVNQSKWYVMETIELNKQHAAREIRLKSLSSVPVNCWSVNDYLMWKNGIIDVESYVLKIEETEYNWRERVQMTI